MLDLSTCTCHQNLVVKVGPLMSEDHGGDGSSSEKNQADAVSAQLKRDSSFFQCSGYQLVWETGVNTFEL